MPAMSKAKTRLACLGLLFTAVMSATSQAQESFRGKQVTIVVGFTAGGGYDLTARLYARHYGRHLPGNPTVIVSNMPGAGSAVAAASLANSSSQDGTRLGFIAGGAVIDPLLTGKARYDARTFHWIGGRANEPSICGIWHEAGVRTMQDAMTKEAVIGASGPGSRTLSYPKILNELTGTRFKVVTGYPGGNQINLAMERGEVQARNNTWSSWKATRPQWIRDKLIYVVAQAGPRASDLDAPSVEELARTPDDRLIIELIVSGTQLGRPFATTPDIPADRLAALRDAFRATMKDPEFLKDAAQMNFEVDPVYGEPMQKIVEKILSTPKPLAERAKEFLE
jgi:tripartite-type tricarboxylate transporter receptor subunit TctC